MLSTKSARLQQQVQKVYKGKDKEVKKSARNDKRPYVEGLAAEAESAAARGEMSTVYKITKRICGNYTTHSATVKGNDGSTITTESEQADRWIEYFCEVLNHPQSSTGSCRKLSSGLSFPSQKTSTLLMTLHFYQ